MAERRAFALLMEMGTGKTRALIEDFARHVRAGRSMDFLVFAPAGVYRLWERELRLWLPPDVELEVLVWHSSSSKTERDRLQRKVSSRPPTPHALLVNFEAMSTVKQAVAICEDFVSRGGATIVVDESTGIKNYKAERTKAIGRVARAAGPETSWRRIASGLVAPRSPLDVFSQFNFLDPAILGFGSYFGFRSRYAIVKRVPVNGPNKRPVDMVVGYRNLPELRAKISTASFRVTKEECLDLPPKVYLPPRQVELTAEQRQNYDDLRKMAMTTLADGTLITSELAVTTLMKLHQVASGFAIDELGHPHEVKNNRLSSLMEVLDEHEGKAIVWAPFRNVIRTIAAALRERYGDAAVVEYWGDTSSDDRVEAERRFQEDPECTHFVGNPATGGKGITLTRASVVVYYANSWDLEHRLQSEDRPHRAGLTHSVAYVDLVARGTVDEKVVKALREKIDLSSALTGDVAREWLTL